MSLGTEDKHIKTIFTRNKINITGVLAEKERILNHEFPVNNIYTFYPDF
jgi:hypothetical protein